MLVRIQKGIVPHDQVPELDSILTQYAEPDEEFVRELVSMIKDSEIELGEDFLRFPPAPMSRRFLAHLGQLAECFDNAEIRGNAQQLASLEPGETTVCITLRLRRRKPAN